MFYGTKVEILIDTTIATSNVLQIFKINPPTDNGFKARLKSAADTDYIYRLGGKVWVDFSDRVKSISITRGKSRFEDRMNVSNATVIFDNADGYFNRFIDFYQNPYALEFVPKRQVRITKYLLSGLSGETETIFTGKTLAWNNNYNGRLDDTTVMTANDAINDIGNQLLSATTFSSELSSVRINTVLDALGWPTADRDIDTGTITLQADTITDGTNALDYLDTVTRTEGGFFYISAEGNFCFRNRTKQAPSGSPTPNSLKPLNVTLRNGFDTLFNRFSLSRLGGGTVVIDSNTPTTTTDPFSGNTITIPGSQNRFGVIEYDREGLLFTSDADLTDLGLDLATWLATDVDRPDAVSWLASEDESQFSVNPYPEIGQVFNYVYPGLPLDQVNLIASVQHNITPETHTMTVGLLNAL